MPVLELLTVTSPDGVGGTTSVSTPSFVWPAGADYAIVFSTMRGFDGTDTTLTRAFVNDGTADFDANLNPGTTASPLYRRFQSFQGSEGAYMRLVDMPAAGETCTLTCERATNFDLGFTCGIIICSGGDQTKVPQTGLGSQTGSPADPYITPFTPDDTGVAYDVLGTSNGAASFEPTAAQTPPQTELAEWNGGDGSCHNAMSRKATTAGVATDMDWDTNGNGDRTTQIIMVVPEAPSGVTGAINSTLENATSTASGIVEIEPTGTIDVTLGNTTSLGVGTVQTGIGNTLVYEDKFDRADAADWDPDWLEDTEGANTPDWFVASEEGVGNLPPGGGTSSEWNSNVVLPFAPTNQNYRITCDVGAMEGSQYGFWLRRSGFASSVSGYLVRRNGGSLAIDRWVLGVATQIFVVGVDGGLLQDTQWTIEIEDVAGDPQITVFTNGPAGPFVHTDTDPAAITDIGTVGVAFQASAAADLDHFWDNFRVFGYGGIPTAQIDYYLVGDPAGTTAKIKLKSPAGLPTALEYSVNEDFSGSVTTATQVGVEGSNWIIEYDLARLLPETRYYYRAVENGAVDIFPGTFRTLQDKGVPVNLTMAFGSCALTGSVADVFSRMQARNPDIWGHLGDLHYQDIDDPVYENAVQDFRDAYQDVFTSFRQNELLRNLWLMWMCDDHDYGANNSGASSPSRTAFQDTARETFPQTRTNPSGSIEFYRDIGRFRFMFPDLRSERDVGGGSPTFMGSTQLTEFLNVLTDAANDPDIQFVVFESGSVWISDGGSDDWSEASAERTQIWDHIDSLGIRDRIITIAGDMHAVAMDDGTNNDFGTVPAPGWRVYQSAAYDQATSIKGGPYTTGPFAADDGQYSILTLTDDGTTITVQVDAYDINDALLYTDSFSFNTPAGTMANTLEDATSTASATVTAFGGIDSTLEDATMTGVGDVENEIEGTIDVTLEDATGVAAGVVTAVGTVDNTLEDAVSTASAELTVVGTSANTLGDATSASTGTVTVTGVVVGVLEDSVSTGTGVIGDVVAGFIDSTLEDATMDGMGEVDQSATGTIDVTLGDATSEAAGTVTQAIDGTIDVTLEDAQGTGTGVVDITITGTIDVNLEDATSIGLGFVGGGIQGSINATLGDCTARASGFVGPGPFSKGQIFRITRPSLRFLVP